MLACPQYVQRDICSKGWIAWARRLSIVLGSLAAVTDPSNAMALFRSVQLSERSIGMNGAAGICRATSASLDARTASTRMALFRTVESGSATAWRRAASCAEPLTA